MSMVSGLITLNSYKYGHSIFYLLVGVASPGLHWKLIENYRDNYVLWMVSYLLFVIAAKH
jgi:hypothetical protein